MPAAEPDRVSPVRVVTAAESAAYDLRIIENGTPSRALMQRAGAAAAGEIARRWPELLRQGVLVLAGSGNNGGDGWIVARALSSAGVSVRVASVAEPRTEDAVAEWALAAALVENDSSDQRQYGIVVDALLGTGSRGEPRGEIVPAVRRAATLRSAGALVVALDVPSGLDASTGDAGLAVTADCTLSFGTMKRGCLLRRDLCGTLVVLDIGLPDDDVAEQLPLLADRSWVRKHMPDIAPDAHKGTRGRLAIVGGDLGMAGAPALAARAAMRSGIGMVRLIVPPAALPVVQSIEPHAIARSWSGDDPPAGVLASIRDWADGVLLGPGLGNSGLTRAIVEHVLESWRGPVVLDADALNVFAGDADELGALLRGRPALVTPHPAELARLAECQTAEVLERRFDMAAEMAGRLDAVVLLKGVPTVVCDPAGRCVVSARGTPVLAAAGSGDLLAGICATLLTQHGDALAAAAGGAWVHGRAAEIAGESRAPHGISLDEIASSIAHVWDEQAERLTYPVLAELPTVRGDAMREA